MQKISYLIESNPAASMVVGGLLGLALPLGSFIPPVSITLILAALIFLSCFRMTVTLQESVSWNMLCFWVLRFLALPIVCWLACDSIVPAYAPGLLLLALCPAGASSAALTGLYGGNVSAAFVLTLVSSLACILSIPLLTGLLSPMAVNVSPWTVLQTMMFCILLPAVLHRLLRERSALKELSSRYGRLTSVLLISLMTLITITQMREEILTSPTLLIQPLMLGIVFYGIVLAVGFSWRGSMQNRIAYGICSTFNNNGLGIGLALLYFDTKTVALLFSTEIIWSLLPLIVPTLLKWLNKEAVKA